MSPMLVSVIALIIGCNGQDGKILSARLSEQGYKILGVASTTAHFESKPISFSDLSNPLEAQNFLEVYKPKLIFHVAAVHGSSETQSAIIAKRGNDMRSCHVGITKNVLEWLNSNPYSKFHVALSSQMYDPSKSNSSITENTEPSPYNLYGETKYEAWLLAREFRDKYELNVSCSILFNHASIFGREEFVFTQLASQFSEVINNQRDVLVLRDPKAWINISSAFEICDGIIQIVASYPREDFILASSQSVRLGRVVVEVAKKLGLTRRIGNLDLFDEAHSSEGFRGLRPVTLKAQELLNWKAAASPSEILEEMVAHNQGLLNV